MMSSQGWWRRTWDMFYGRTAIVFSSRYLLAESVNHLETMLRPGEFSLSRIREAMQGAHEGLDGMVTTSKVHLRHVRPMLQKYRGAVFVGYWQQTPEGLVLSGYFRPHMFELLFRSICLAFMLIWTSMALLAGCYGIAKGNYADLLFPVVGVLVLVFLFARVSADRKLAAGDEVFITTAIHKALGK